MQPEQINFTLNSGASVYINFTSEATAIPQITIASPNSASPAPSLMDTAPAINADAEPIPELLSADTLQPEANENDILVSELATDNQSQTEELERLQWDNKRLQNENSENLKENVRLSKALEKSKQHTDKLDEEIAGLKQEIKSSEAKCKATATAMETTAIELKKQMNDVLQECSDKTAQLQQAEKDRKELEKQLTEAHDNEAMYLEEITELEETNKTQRSTITSLSSHLDGIRNKSTSGTPILVEGTEHDLFPGEISDYILEIIKEKLATGVPEKSRLHDVLSSIVEANQYQALHENLRKNLKTEFKKAGNDATRIARVLSDCGLECDRTSKHTKYVYHGDERYTATISVSPSDVRASTNTVGQIISQIL